MACVRFAFTCSTTLAASLWLLSSASGAEPGAVLDAQEFWGQVRARNQVWLAPPTAPLSYTLTARLLKTEPPKRIVNRVWCSGGKSRWEMERLPKEDPADHRLVMPHRYKVVCDGADEAYLEGPDQLTERAPRSAREHPELHQGIYFHSAMHAAWTDGLPGNAKVVEPEHPEPGTVVLEADFGTARGGIGLGLYHSFFGRSGYRLDRVRLHIKTPELVPLREEYLDRETLLEYAEPFLVIGDQRAPSVVRHIATLGRDKGEWVLEARFQSVEDRWLLDRAVNLQNGKTVAEIELTDLSTDPINPEQFKLPTR